MQPNGAAEPHGSGIDYPRVTVNGASYEVKWTNATLYRLSKMGVDMAQFSANLKASKIELWMVYDVLSACIQGHRFHPEDLAEAVPVAAAAKVVMDALGKVSPPAMAQAPADTNAPKLH